MSIQIESDLKEILGRIDSKLDKLSEDVTDINLRLTKVETKLDEGVVPRLDSLSSEIKEIKGVQQAQIWTLIGILITAVGGFLVAAGRLVNTLKRSS